MPKMIAITIRRLQCM